jgi:hypothetical protein
MYTYTDALLQAHLKPQKHLYEVSCGVYGRISRRCTNINQFLLLIYIFYLLINLNLSTINNQHFSLTAAK